MLNKNIKPAGILKRISAIFYDLILLAALFIIASAIAILFNDNKALANGNLIMLFWLFLVGFLYYGLCWKISGQTLGLKTWRLRVVSLDNKSLSWQTTLLKYILSPLLFLIGIGFLWMIFNKKKLTLYDLITKTKVINENLKN